MSSRGGSAAAKNPIRRNLVEILEGYRAAVGGVVSGATPVRPALKELAERFQLSEVVRAHPAIQVTVSPPTGKPGEVPRIAFRDPRSDVYVTLLFGVTKNCVYLTIAPNAKEGKAKADAAPEKIAGPRPSFTELTDRGFGLGDATDPDIAAPQGAGHDPAAVVSKRYPKRALPADAVLLADLEAALSVHDLPVAEAAAAGPPPPVDAVRAAPQSEAPFDRKAALDELTKAIAARGYVFEPWQIAAYVTALRTKPFVLLAGVSGTGKSRLPALCADITGGVSETLPVRPDWTDSSDVLGFTDLAGRFNPGALLDLAKRAAARPEVHHVCVVDEMNLARVEQYFAEVLSRMEDRGEGIARRPLLSQPPSGDAAPWGHVALPENLALVGTVNMDETTHGFSRKVLDRAFSLEISDIDLASWGAALAAPPAVRPWPAGAFRPRAVRLGELSPSSAEAEIVKEAIDALVAVNAVLGRAQLQVGYRVRDEVALFLIHAGEVHGAFVTRGPAPLEKREVAPLDLALVMKILPRIAGGSVSIRNVVTSLFGWASKGHEWADEEAAAPALAAGKEAGRPASVERARFPRMAARLALMLERLLAEGYTSFWA